MQKYKCSVFAILDHFGQSIQEWSTWDLWKKTFKKFEIVPCPITKHKNTCAGTLILVKVAGWSAVCLKLALLPKWCKLWQIQNKTNFHVILLCFSRLLKTRIFTKLENYTDSCYSCYVIKISCNFIGWKPF